MNNAIKHFEGWKCAKTTHHFESTQASETT